MSGRLLNPLDKFPTYSTQFILLACRSSDAAKKFAQDVDATGNQERLRALDAVQKLGDPVKFGDSGMDEIFVVIDTRKFSQFIVESLKYETWLGGLPRGQHPPSNPTLIDMTVTDSAGISFINYVQWLIDQKLEANFDGIIFLLKIVFVGHKADGSTETVHTVTIPMQLLSMVLALDSAKGKYDCKFMPNTNFSVNFNDRWTHIGQATTMFAEKSTLKELISSFEKKLNDTSKDYFNQVQASLGGNSAGRLVQYNITIPPEWNNFAISGGVAKFLEEQFPKPNTTEKTPDKDKGHSVSAAPNITILGVLEKILHQKCEDIKKLLVEPKNPKDPKKTFKYITGVTSTKEQITVHVDIVEFTITPNADTSASGQKNAAGYSEKLYTVKEGSNQLIPKSYFELDYIYTGKNLDILNLDLKVENLQFFLAANVKTGAGEMYSVAGKGQNNNTNGNASKTPTKVVGIRKYDPILMPLVTNDQAGNFNSVRNNKEGVELMQAYTQNLARFYAQSPIQAHVTIRGNPNIMTKFCTQEFLPSTTEKDEYRMKLSQVLGAGQVASVSSAQGKEQIGGESFLTEPVFVKLNVKGPANAEFIAQDLRSNEFASELLYDTYFEVRRVANTIQNGSFTQELELWIHTLYQQPKTEEAPPAVVKK